MPYVPTFDRNQMMMCSWDAFVDSESIARLIDAFVNSLDLTKYGVKEAAVEGRPPYDPSLKFIRMGKQELRLLFKIYMNIYKVVIWKVNLPISLVNLSWWHGQKIYGEQNNEGLCN